MHIEDTNLNLYVCTFYIFLSFFVVCQSRNAYCVGRTQLLQIILFVSE